MLLSQIMGMAHQRNCQEKKVMRSAKSCLGQWIGRHDHKMQEVLWKFQKGQDSYKILLSLNVAEPMLECFIYFPHTFRLH